MLQQIVDGVLVTTTEQDLPVYIAKKQRELDILGQQIARLQAMQTKILADLSSLVNQQEAQ